MQARSRVALHALVLLFLYQSLRFYFWWHNRELFPELQTGTIEFLVLQGLRYDLSALAMSNGLAYVLFLTPWPQAWLGIKRWLCLILAFTASSLSIAFNLVDVEYFKFSGKRLTFDSFAIAQDINQQFGQIVSYYWFNSLLLLLLWAGIFWLSYRLLKPSPTPVQLYRQALTWLVAVALVVLTLRGGWQIKPLIAAQAFTRSGGRAGVIALNSTFTLLKSSQKASLPELHFFGDAELKEVLAQFEPPPLPSLPPEERPKNVIIVILESFAKEYVEPSPGHPSYAPFLYRLMQKGSSFPLSFANGRRSIDALPAILASIPAWMEPPYITSPYQTNQVVGLAEALKPAGYTSSFYHGGTNGTMFFDVMAERFGFDRYVGQREYPDSADFDGQWGIFDEPFLQFVIRDINKQASPFLAAIFTLSSHHPYTVPSPYRNRFPKGTLEIHESIGYADFALQKFYEEAQRQPWFADTLFIFTADHTSKSDAPSYDTAEGRFAVPILFIQNDKALSSLHQLGQPAQHVDIMPTVLDLLAAPPRSVRSPFGQSLRAPLTRPGVILYENPTYNLFSGNSLLSWSPDVENAGEKPLVNERALTFLKSQIQAYNNGMVRNQLIW